MTGSQYDRNKSLSSQIKVPDYVQNPYDNVNNELNQKYKDRPDL